MNIYSSNYLEANYNKDIRLITFLWKENTSDLSDDIFKKELQKEIYCIENHPCDKLLINSKNFTYLISFEVQDWISEEILPAYSRAGIRKIAFVQSDEFIAQLSIEQTMLRAHLKQRYVSKYFKSKNSAMNWLMDRR